MNRSPHGGPEPLRQVPPEPVDIAPSEGKLGVLLPGLGAVATTFVAGVEAVRTGQGKPFGSLTQMGTIGSLTQAAASVTGEVLTASATPGRYYQTAFKDISNLVVNVSAVAQVEGTDYAILDAFEGIIQVLEGGEISEGDQLDVDYDHAEIAAPGLQTVRGGAAGVIEGRIRYIGDPTAGEVRNVDIWKVSLEPDSAIDLIGDDFGEWTLSAEILDDSENHPDAPFYEMLYTGEAR